MTIETLAMTTGNEVSAKAKAKTVTTVKPLPFTRDDVFAVVGTTPKTGTQAVAALALFADKCGQLDVKTGKKGTLRILLKQFAKAYAEPQTLGQVEIGSVVASGVQSPIFKACWSYLHGFAGCAVPTKGKGPTGGDFTGGFQRAVAAVVAAKDAKLDPANPDNLTDEATPVVKTDLETVDLASLLG